MSDVPTQHPVFDMPLHGFDVRGAWVIKHLIVDLDLTAEQAAGIVGNLGGESGLMAIQERNPIAGRGGFGWAQWTGPRRVAFEHWCADHDLSTTSDEANYNYLLEELRGEQAHSLEQLKKTTALDTAVYTFCIYFERPSDPEGGQAPRLAFAKRALAALGTPPDELEIPPKPKPLPVNRLPLALRTQPEEPQPQPEPTVTIMTPVEPTVPLLSRLGALGIGGAASYVPAQTLVEIIAGIMQQSWFTQKIQDDCVISLVIIGGWFAHSAILAALKSKIMKDFQ